MPGVACVTRRGDARWVGMLEGIWNMLVGMDNDHSMAHEDIQRKIFRSVSLNRFNQAPQSSQRTQSVAAFFLADFVSFAVSSLYAKMNRGTLKLNLGTILIDKNKHFGKSA